MATILTDHASVEKILQEMTVAEKARMVIGGTPFHTEAIPKYKIPSMYMIDSGNGLNSLEYLGERVYQKIAADAEAAAPDRLFPAGTFGCVLLYPADHRLYGRYLPGKAETGEKLLPLCPVYHLSSPPVFRPYRTVQSHLTG